MAPKRSSTRAKQGLAQPTLSFQTRKPGTTGKKPSLSSVRSVSATSIRREPSTDDAAAASRPASPAVAERDSIDVTDRPGPHAAAEKAQHQLDEGKKRKRPELDVDDKAWEGVRRQAFKEMGGMKPIHAGPDTHNDVHHILRVFDLTSSYGPCVGITRLQRWERAHKWGLNPPPEIKAILTTRQGEDEDDYRENVLHAWLG